MEEGLLYWKKRVAIRSRGGAGWSPIWKAPFADDINFQLSGVREGDLMKASIGSDATIVYPHYRKATVSAGNFSWGSDNGDLDILNNHLTLAAWVKYETGNKTTDRMLIGKNIAGNVVGRYGFNQEITTGYLVFNFQTTTAFYAIKWQTDFTTTTEWIHLYGEINQTTGKARFFVNNVQVGADLDFAGSFNALANGFKFVVGAGNNSTGTDFTRISGLSTYDICLYFRLLSDDERLAIFNHNVPVSGIKSYWTCEDPDSGYVCDIESGHHLTNFGTARYIGWGSGSRYSINNGYEYYSNGCFENYLGVKPSGGMVSIPFTTGVRHHNTYQGYTDKHNLANTMLLFTGAQFDRSNATIYNATARTANHFYDAAVPRRWHISEINHLYNHTLCNDNYKGVIFSRYYKNSFYNPGYLAGIITYANSKNSQSDYEAVLATTGDMVDVFETKNFYYKWVKSNIWHQRGNIKIRYINPNISMSEDGGATYPHSYNIGAISPQLCHIFDNGNVLFSSSTQLYLTTDKFATVTPITAKDITGNDYVAPAVDAFNPGFRSETNGKRVGGNEMFVWGRYQTATNGDNDDINIWYTVDNGATVKSAYKAGVTNPPNLPARHVHMVEYRESDDSWWVNTGDNNPPYENESNYIRGVYDSGLDTWTWSKIYGDVGAGRTYQHVGHLIIGDNIGFADELRPTFAYCAVSDFGNSSLWSHVLRYPISSYTLSLNKAEDKLIGTARPSINRVWMVTSEDQDFAKLEGCRVFYRFHQLTRPIVESFFFIDNIDADGWVLVHFLVDSESLPTHRLGDVLMIKIK